MDSTSLVRVLSWLNDPQWQIAFFFLFLFLLFNLVFIPLYCFFPLSDFVLIHYFELLPRLISNFFYMKSQWNVFKRIIFNKLIVGFKIIKECFFVSQIPVKLQMIVDTGLLWIDGFLKRFRKRQFRVKWSKIVLFQLFLG